MRIAITFFSILLLSINGYAQAFTGIRSIRPFTPDPRGETFSAIYYKWNIGSDIWKNNPDTLALIHIDSIGRIRFCAALDPSLRGYDAKILSDTLLLLESGDYSKTTITIYNVLNRKRKIFLAKSLVSSIGDDRSYFTCQRDNISTIAGDYHVKNGDVITDEKIVTPLHIHSPFGLLGFIAVKDSITKTDISSFTHNYESMILRYDGSIADSIPKDFAHWYIQHGKNDREIIYIHPEQRGYRGDSNPVIAYNLDRKTRDTLFSGLIFLRAYAVANTDYYLLNGLSQKQWKEQLDDQVESFKRVHPKGEAIDDLNTPFGYWMIGNSKTKKIKKIGYKDFCLCMSVHLADIYSLVNKMIVIAR